jgi:hypothetical protein
MIPSKSCLAPITPYHYLGFSLSSLSRRARGRNLQEPN